MCIHSDHEPFNVDSVFQFINHVHTHPSHVPEETNGLERPRLVQIHKVGEQQIRTWELNAWLFSRLNAAHTYGHTYHPARVRTEHTDAAYWDAHLVDEQMLDCS